LSLLYAEIQERMANVDLSQLTELHISVLRNITIEPIEPYLCYYAYQMGFNAQVVFGGSDNIVQESIADDSLFTKETDSVLIFMKLEAVSWQLARNFAELKPSQVRSEVVRIQEHIARVLTGICRQTDAMILWHGFELPINPSLGIWDSQINNGQIAVIQQLNDCLKDQLRERTNAYYVDINLCLSRLGATGFYDLRYWHLGRSPYTRKALNELAFEEFKFIRSLMGKNKKCLVLDCDNILWGGVIGEDGLSGIKLGKNYPGSSYYEFQQEIVNLYNRGILIALCSKNNEPDVEEVFQKHPDMLLKKEHIATFQINWQDKATNLRQIAVDLNIGLDSIVFIDDSEFEVNLIREMLPEVESLLLSKERAVEYRDLLASHGLFDTLTFSAEDRNRGAMYQAEGTRKKLKKQVTDLESYYKSLEMVVYINFADEFSIPRIAQQTQKTNQFNLTTRRYSEANIKAYMESEISDVIYLRLIDKFGDSGIVGTSILKYDDDRAIFDTFLLSCRVLGRGVENAFIAQILKLAKKRNCKWAIGEYYATRKNIQVRDFYRKHGFKEIMEENKKPGQVFCFELEGTIPTEPPYFKEIKSELQEDSL